MIGIVCAFFHTEGKGFYSKQEQKKTISVPTITVLTIIHLIS